MAKSRFPAGLLLSGAFNILAISSEERHGIRRISEAIASPKILSQRHLRRPEAVRMSHAWRSV